MADDHEAGLQPEHELLEPLEPGEVEVVGRLVEQEHVVAAEQHAGQRGPGRLPAGQRRRLRVEQAERQPEVRAHLLGAHVEVGAAEVEPAGQRLVVVRARPRRWSARRSRRRASACAAATPVRRARKAVSVSPGRRSGSCGSSPTVAVRRRERDAAGVGLERRRRASPAGSTCPAPLGPTTPTRRARGDGQRDARQHQHGPADDGDAGGDEGGGHAPTLGLSCPARSPRSKRTGPLQLVVRARRRRRGRAASSRNCAVCRNRAPSMWSYATSTTSSGRSGTKLMSLSRFHRLGSPPGARSDGRLAEPRVRLALGQQVRRELVHQLPAPGHREARGHADVLQPALVVVQAEHERARPPARSCASGTRPPRSRPSGRA